MSKQFDANGTDIDAYSDRAYQGGVYDGGVFGKNRNTTMHVEHNSEFKNRSDKNDDLRTKFENWLIVVVFGLLIGWIIAGVMGWVS